MSRLEGVINSDILVKAKRVQKRSTRGPIVGNLSACHTRTDSCSSSSSYRLSSSSTFRVSCGQCRTAAGLPGPYAAMARIMFRSTDIHRGLWQSLSPSLPGMPRSKRSPGRFHIRHTPPSNPSRPHPHPPPPPSPPTCTKVQKKQFFVWHQQHFQHHTSSLSNTNFSAKNSHYFLCVGVLCPPHDQAYDTFRGSDCCHQILLRHHRLLCRLTPTSLPRHVQLPQQTRFSVVFAVALPFLGCGGRPWPLGCDGDVCPSSLWPFEWHHCSRVADVDGLTGMGCHCSGSHCVPPSTPMIASFKCTSAILAPNRSVLPSPSPSSDPSARAHFKSAPNSNRVGSNHE